MADQATRPPVEGHGTIKERSVPAPAGGDGGRRVADAPRSSETGFQSGGGGGAAAAPQEAPQVGTTGSQSLVPHNMANTICRAGDGQPQPIAAYMLVQRPSIRDYAPFTDDHGIDIILLHRRGRRRQLAS